MHRLFSSNRSINVSNLDDGWVWEGVGECAVAQTLKNLIFFAVTDSIEYTLCYFSPIPLQRFVSFFSRAFGEYFCCLFIPITFFAVSGIGHCLSPAVGVESEISWFSGEWRGDQLSLTEY